ncbi:alpha/beta hydrolase [Aquihabitans sp. McL0605]|uniref:alpha/beta hydrolase n=1 Tax=Aquihabitans sp. McL0605 TaxID=3415671 RepID=UPI003CF3292E
MKRAAIVVLAGALLVAGCSTTGGNDAGPTSTTSSSTSSKGSTPSPVPGAPAIDWHDCGGGFQCGDMEVPLDYAKPDGKKIQIAVTRHPADKPDERIGALFMNPGGPGASAIDLARNFSRAGEIGDRFDIVGFDPRGVGESSPLDCHSHLLDIYDADPTIDSAADRAETLKASKEFVDECRRKYGPILPFLGTTNVARDMDQVRQALGDDQLNYLGYSYGTSLGQEYARLFPTHVRSMVLDGVVDHAPDGLTTAEEQAGGFTTAMKSYVAHCKAEGCGFDKPADQVIDDVVAQAEKAAIPAPNANRPAGPGVVSLALAQALYSETLWGTLSSALRDAQDGDGSGLVDLADQYLGRNDDGTYSGMFEIYFAVSCLDDSWPTDPGKVFAAAAKAAKKDPLFGSPIVLDYIRCAMWPAKPEPLKPVPADTKGLPPIVVISTTKDPATPYENGVAVAEQIPTGVLVTNVGEGHTIVGQGKPCIDDMVADYFIDLTVPEDGLVCK